MKPQRQRLPNRRPSETRTLEVAGQVFIATVGIDPNDDRPLEIFLSGAKDGSGLAAILYNASVIISIALQHSVNAAALSKSVARIPAAPLVPTNLATPSGPAHTAPTSIIGTALYLLCGYETRGEETA